MRAYLPAILCLAVAVPALCVQACSSDDATATPATTDAGGDGATATDTGTDSGADTASPSLYQTLGGQAGITKFVTDVLTAEVSDPTIAPFFAPNLASAAGHPTAQQIGKCLILQISAASADKTKGDPEFTYPGPIDDGYVCRDMKTTHAGLGISDSVFSTFAQIATTVAQKDGLSGTTLDIVGQFLSSQKTLIVEASDGGADGSADGSSDAAADGD